MQLKRERDRLGSLSNANGFFMATGRQCKFAANCQLKANPSYASQVLPCVCVRKLAQSTCLVTRVESPLIKYVVRDL